jgi:hypothetical protein
MAALRPCEYRPGLVDFILLDLATVLRLVMLPLVVNVLLLRVVEDRSLVSGS